jgi:hypothetical protein
VRDLGKPGVTVTRNDPAEAGPTHPTSDLSRSSPRAPQELGDRRRNGSAPVQPGADPIDLDPADAPQFSRERALEAAGRRRRFDAGQVLFSEGTTVVTSSSS